jgi:hypothetical protein
MCTLVCRWQPNEEFAVQLLALRDEYASREFDPPEQWWPDYPGVVGGQDRSKGGSWCVSDVATGSTAVVLNNPVKKTASLGAPSRGVLPLLAVRYGQLWSEHLTTKGMAGFHLVLATPESLQWWSFDGENLIHEQLFPGTYMFTPRELHRSEFGDDRLAEGRFRYEAGRTAPTHLVWDGWVNAVAETLPTTDPADLLVCVPDGDETYETVFAQCIASRAGQLRVDYLNRPVENPRGEWSTRTWELTSP